MSRLAGKVAIVTGAASGIGACSACTMAREGARVVVAGRNGAGAAGVAADTAPFLAYDESSFITGLTIRCDGGQLSHLPHVAGLVAMNTITTAAVK